MMLEEKELLERRKQLREEAIINEMSRLKTNNSKLSLKYKVLLSVLIGFVVGFAVLLYYFKNDILNEIEYNKPIKEQSVEVLQHRFKIVYFRIQIGSYVTRHPELIERIFEEGYVDEYKDSRYRYFIGEFVTLEESNRILEEIKRQGYMDAFIVPFRNDLPVSWDKVWSELRAKKR
ncbi:SPOR domain-containing protein [Halosquirtibacter xylanolyticus]|uniref:SPOR domain-containing protein n=1 Tax=Halosquirtibacter xylanolyticus TaxID=3374599 RepID=UPI0037485BA6|nr:SPOR domain-containing protein [Prolixibacteraceae bacterium]